LESSCEFGIETPGSIKCWETSSVLTVSDLSSSAQLHSQSGGIEVETMEPRRGDGPKKVRESLVYKTHFLTGNTLRLRYKAQPVNDVWKKQPLFIVRTTWNTIFKDSVRTLHETQNVSAAKPTRLMLLGETVVGFEFRLKNLLSSGFRWYSSVPTNNVRILPPFGRAALFQITSNSSSSHLSNPFQLSSSHTTLLPIAL
jgi:hypothetical protein